MRPPHSPVCNSRQAGLSLIELMIATVVGLILIAGVLSIFLSSRKTYGINSAVAQIQENGRAALNFIRVNTRMAGYMGCGASGASFVNQLNAPAGAWPLPFDFGTAITGFEYNGTGPTDSYTVPATIPTSTPQASWAPTLSTSIPTTTANADRAVPGSDIFAVSISQGVTTPSYVTTVGGAAVANTFTLVANNNALQANDLMVISNCATTVVREATAMSGLTITADPAASVAGNPGNSGAALIVPQNAQVTTASVVAYYVGVTNDGSPALFEALTDTTKSSGFRPEEIAPGVVNMQVLYGIDPTHSGQNPSRYVTADNVVAPGTTWDDVVSVRVALLLQSGPGALPIPATAQKYDLLGTEITAPRDTRLRQIFTSTIMLRNR